MQSCGSLRIHIASPYDDSESLVGVSSEVSQPPPPPSRPTVPATRIFPTHTILP